MFRLIQNLFTGVAQYPEDFILELNVKGLSLYKKIKFKLKNTSQLKGTLFDLTTFGFN